VLRLEERDAVNEALAAVLHPEKVACQKIA
jgi:hypothetical protein